MISLSLLPWHAKTVESNFCQCNVDYRTQVYLGSDLWVRVSETTRPCANLTDVTFADEDTSSILANDTNRAFKGNVAMQVTQVASSGGQILK